MVINNVIDTILYFEQQQLLLLTASGGTATQPCACAYKDNEIKIN